MITRDTLGKEIINKWDTLFEPSAYRLDWLSRRLCYWKAGPVVLQVRQILDEGMLALDLGEPSFAGLNR